jgi:hypothetical protein
MPLPLEDHMDDAKDVGGAMNWFRDIPSLAANSAAAFFTDAGSFNG